MVTLTKEKMVFELAKLEDAYAENGNEIRRISSLSRKIKEEREDIGKGEESIMVSVCSMIIPCNEVTAPVKLSNTIGADVCKRICETLDVYVEGLIKKNDDIMRKITNYKKTLNRQ